MKPHAKPKQHPKPPWLRLKLPSGPQHEQIRTLIREGNLHTVCQEAKCPNQFECFSARTATFLILGSVCTRHCGFCNIEAGAPAPVDPAEPQRVADAAARMQLRYVVVTSVTRDDLPDGGAAVFAETIQCIRNTIPTVQVEVLIPDFLGRPEALATVVKASPDVLNHNIETVPRLYATVRPEADYRRSLKLLESAHRMNAALALKSGIMLGLGETWQEVKAVLTDLLAAGCRMLTIGQYLQPSDAHLRVERFVEPEEFDRWRQTALDLGFTEVASGPFVRSSYHAREMFHDGSV